MEVQGWVVIALTLLLLGYLLPHVVRSRQLLLDSRAEDRFSADLRILATAGTGGRTRVVAGGAHHRDEKARPYLHQRRSEAPAVKRPTTRSARAEQDARALAAARAARAAEISRRAAAARRRLILTLVLLALTGAAWLGVGLTGLTWSVAAVPSVLLLTVLVAGRRAAVRAKQRDAAARADMARLEQRLMAVSGRGAVAPSARQARTAHGSRPLTDTTTTARRATGSASVEAGHATSPAAPAQEEAVPESPAEEDAGHGAPEAARPTTAETSPGGADRAAPAVDAQVAPADATPAADPGDTEGVTPGGSEEHTPSVGVTAAPRPDDAPGTSATSPASAGDRPATEPWTPVPVPLPTYTLKATAPRMAVAPYEAAATTQHVAVPTRPTHASPAPQPSATEESPAAAALDLEAVLARRRAAGA